MEVTGRRDFADLTDFTAMSHPNEVRDLTDETKLTFRSIPEVAQVAGALASRIKHHREIRWKNGKRPTGAAALNALVLWLDSRSQDEQDAIIATGMARLDALLGYGGEPKPAMSQGRPKRNARGNAS